MSFKLLGVPGTFVHDRYTCTKSHLVVTVLYWPVLLVISYLGFLVSDYDHL